MTGSALKQNQGVACNGFEGVFGQRLEWGFLRGYAKNPNVWTRLTVFC